MGSEKQDIVVSLRGLHFFTYPALLYCAIDESKSKRFLNRTLSYAARPSISAALQRSEAARVRRRELHVSFENAVVVGGSNLPETVTFLAVLCEAARTAQDYKPVTAVTFTLEPVSGNHGDADDEEQQHEQAGSKNVVLELPDDPLVRPQLVVMVSAHHPDMHAVAPLGGPARRITTDLDTRGKLFGLLPDSCPVLAAVHFLDLAPSLDRSAPSLRNESSTNATGRLNSSRSQPTNGSAPAAAASAAGSPMGSDTPGAAAAGGQALPCTLSLRPGRVAQSVCTVDAGDQKLNVQLLNLQFQCQDGSREGEPDGASNGGGSGGLAAGGCEGTGLVQLRGLTVSCAVAVRETDASVAAVAAGADTDALVEYVYVFDDPAWRMRRARRGRGGASRRARRQGGQGQAGAGAVVSGTSPEVSRGLAPTPADRADGWPLRSQERAMWMERQIARCHQQSRRQNAKDGDAASAADGAAPPPPEAGRCFVEEMHVRAGESFRCPLCSVRSPSFQALRTHLTATHNLYRYRCRSYCPPSPPVGSRDPEEAPESQPQSRTEQQVGQRRYVVELRLRPELILSRRKRHDLVLPREDPTQIWSYSRASGMKTPSAVVATQSHPDAITPDKFASQTGATTAGPPHPDAPLGVTPQPQQSPQQQEQDPQLPPPPQQQQQQDWPPPAPADLGCSGGREPGYLAAGAEGSDAGPWTAKQRGRGTGQRGRGTGQRGRRQQRRSSELEVRAEVEEAGVRAGPDVGEGKELTEAGPEGEAGGFGDGGEGDDGEPPLLRVPLETLKRSMRAEPPAEVPPEEHDKKETEAEEERAARAGVDPSGAAARGGRVSGTATTAQASAAVTLPPGRRYYRSRGIVPRAAAQVAGSYDSEDDTDDEEWEAALDRQLAAARIEAPLLPEECRFSRMWNQFARRQPLFADHVIPFRCLQFAREHGADLRSDPKLRTALTLHLSVLHSYNLLDPRTMLRCAQLADGRITATEEEDQLFLGNRNGTTAHARGQTAVAAVRNGGAAAAVAAAAGRGGTRKSTRSKGDGKGDSTAAEQGRQRGNGDDAAEGGKAGGRPAAGREAAGNDGDPSLRVTARRRGKRAGPETEAEAAVEAEGRRVRRRIAEPGTSAQLLPEASQQPVVDPSQPNAVPAHVGTLAAAPEGAGVVAGVGGEAATATVAGSGGGQAAAVEGGLAREATAAAVGLLDNSGSMVQSASPRDNTAAGNLTEGNRGGDTQPAASTASELDHQPACALVSPSPSSSPPRAALRDPLDRPPGAAGDAPAPIPGRSHQWFPVSEVDRQPEPEQEPLPSQGESKQQPQQQPTVTKSRPALCWARKSRGTTGTPPLMTRPSLVNQQLGRGGAALQQQQQQQGNQPR